VRLANTRLARADFAGISRLSWRGEHHIEEKNLTMTDAIVVIGAGSIGQAIARRVSAGKRVLLADLKRENADAAAKVLNDAGFNVSTAVVERPRATTSMHLPSPPPRLATLPA
jgi:threonine dehydrogenase-like Zn-dependent dehydrogenase